MSRTDIRPQDHDERMAAARRRASWELGDPSWAGVLIGAYLYPEDSDERLRDEQDEAPTA